MKTPKEEYWLWFCQNTSESLLSSMVRLWRKPSRSRLSLSHLKLPPERTSSKWVGTGVRSLSLLSEGRRETCGKRGGRVSTDPSSSWWVSRNGHTRRSTSNSYPYVYVTTSYGGRWPFYHQETDRRGYILTDRPSLSPSHSTRLPHNPISLVT